MKSFPGKLWMFMVFLFLYLPLVILVVYSFNEAKFSTVWQGWSLKWYRELLGNNALINAAIHSVIVAVTASCLATGMGTLGAFALNRYSFIGRRLFYALIYWVMVSPDIVMGIALLMFFVFLGLEPGFITLLVAHVTFCLPFVIVTVLSRIRGFDQNVVDAARDLGAGEFQIFFAIILPMILPAVVSGWLLSFTLSLDDVIISFFVAGPEFEILPLRIYSMVKLGVKPEVNALCAVMFLCTMMVVVFAHFLMKEDGR